MKRICILMSLLLASFLAEAQPLLKKDKKHLANLKSMVAYLADDKLEGRRTGTPGEALAAAYISEAFQKAGLAPLGDKGSFLQAFSVDNGRAIEPATRLLIRNQPQELDKDFFPLAYSGNVTDLRLRSFGDSLVYITDLKNIREKEKNNPHFDLKDHVLTLAKEAEKEGRKLVLITNSAGPETEIRFEANDKTPRLQIPVIFVSRLQNAGLAATSGEINPDLGIQITVKMGKSQRTGHNVAGYLNNGAQQTIVLGAHYDHLGYGEDKNSLYAGQNPMIHNGADDNASGTSALILLAKSLAKSKQSRYNYLFLAFSGEELGLYGSKYWVEHSTLPLNQINCMINMDMVGRLNDSTHGLTIGGYGTSPAWADIIKTDDPYFKIKIDSSGTGPSDHTSFYRKDIPVLFFFTGTHSDYHKPSDDAGKLNYPGQLAVIRYIYRVLDRVQQQDKLVFTKTREAAATGKSSFKVSLGIMPDYTFSGPGVKADGVSDGKAAQKAGIKAGDVILKLGPHNIQDVQGYMQVLGKFNKGEKTTVTISRNGTNQELEIQF